MERADKRLVGIGIAGGSAMVATGTIIADVFVIVVGVCTVALALVHRYRMNEKR